MKARRRRHVFMFGPRGLVVCKRCGLERRFALVEERQHCGTIVTLYRNPARSRAWSSENPGCVS